MVWNKIISHKIGKFSQESTNPFVAHRAEKSYDNTEPESYAVSSQSDKQDLSFFHQRMTNFVVVVDTGPLNVGKKKKNWQAEENWE